MLVFFTDTDCDITPEIAKEYGFQLISMPYIINEVETKPYEDFDEFDAKSFYNSLRNGVLPKTCAISPGKYIEYFEPHFAQGNDILYVHFSKAMSGTFSSMNIALEELKEKYPERKFYSIDTKAITVLSYLIIKEIGKLYKEGKSIEELLAWANENVDKYAIYFYADDLKFFKLSGRVSNFSATMGNILGIHPIIHINQEGIMTNVAKSKGRISTLNKILTMVDEIQEDITKHPIVIAHTDAPELAEKLAEMVKQKYGENVKIDFVMVNPTAGAHCGPNCVGIAFHAKHR
jgi:DegV family protein with EDD domain